MITFNGIFMDIMFNAFKIKINIAKVGYSIENAMSKCFRNKS
jgi:hypothetical protein